jgi:cation diffusion facilitator family transporter
MGERPSEDHRGLWLALGMYLFILALKLIAYFVTGVLAMFAEALHTLSDIFIAGFLLLAAYYSRRRPDPTHMFGYGRAQNIAALVAATLFISFTSFELYREAIPRLWSVEAPHYENLALAIGVLIASMLLAAVPLVKLMRHASRQRGAAAKAQLLELVNDQLGLVAALVGTLFVAGGWPLADALAAIVVATLIAYNAIGLFRENASYLLGRSPGQEYLGRLERLARSIPGVLDVRDMRAEIIGPDTVHAGLTIVVARGLPVETADRIAHEIEARFHAEMPSGYCVIHAEPAPLDGVAQSMNEQMAVP